MHATCKTLRGDTDHVHRAVCTVCIPTCCDQDHAVRYFYLRLDFFKTDPRPRDVHDCGTTQAAATSTTLRNLSAPPAAAVTRDCSRSSLHELHDARRSGRSS